MEIFEDIFAGWSFELSNKMDESNFIQLLSILYESQFLKISNISLDDREELFHSINQTAKLFIECSRDGKNLSLSGVTMLQTKIGSEMFDGVVRLIYEPKINLVSIDTFTDAWMPVGFFDEALQIDSGIANSKNLKRVLKQLYQLKFIKKVDPSDNEYFKDYMIHQIGFDLFYKGNIENINGLAKEDYHKVAPFILSN